MGRGAGGGSRGGGSSQTFYHGTTSLVISSIQKNGLTPYRSGVADEWAQRSGWTIIKNAPNRKASVYLTANKNIAKIYANMAVEVKGGKPVILKIKVPRRIKIKPDEDDSQGIRLEQKVPARWISKEK